MQMGVGETALAATPLIAIPSHRHSRESGNPVNPNTSINFPYTRFKRYEIAANFLSGL